MGKVDFESVVYHFISQVGFIYVHAWLLTIIMFQGKEIICEAEVDSLTYR